MLDLIEQKPHVRRHPGRMRACPLDFKAVYLDIGWDGIEDHYSAHKLTIKRWVEECGGDILRQARARVVKMRRATSRQRGHYQMGSMPIPIEILSDLQSIGQPAPGTRL